MRQETVTRTLYQYDELSDSAKERAAQWYSEACAGDNWFSEFIIIEDFATIAGFCGWDINQRLVKPVNGSTRYEPAVYWSGFWSQGDGACFEGTWRADDVSVTKLREHAPVDKELHRLADEFARLAKTEPAGTATAKHTGHYYHEFSVSLDAYSNDESESAAYPCPHEWAKDLNEARADLCRWLYRTLEKEYEYQFSGEGLVETMRANEYEFDEDGNRA